LLLERFLGVTASWLSAVNAARGGLEGGEGSPEEGTSGIPLCPVTARSAVVEALKVASGVDEVATGKDIGLSDNVLAMNTTTPFVIGLFHGRHCSWSLPL